MLHSILINPAVKILKKQKKPLNKNISKDIEVEMELGARARKTILENHGNT